MLSGRKCSNSCSSLYWQKGRKIKKSVITSRSQSWLFSSQFQPDFCQVLSGLSAYLKSPEMSCQPSVSPLVCPIPWGPGWGAASPRPSQGSAVPWPQRDTLPPLRVDEGMSPYLQPHLPSWSTNPHQLIFLHWALEGEIRAGKDLGNQRCDLEQSVGTKWSAEEKMCVQRVTQLFPVSKEVFVKGKKRAQILKCECCWSWTLLH